MLFFIFNNTAVILSSVIFLKISQACDYENLKTVCHNATPALMDLGCFASSTTVIDKEIN